jgi:hypothetical protein
MKDLSGGKITDATEATAPCRPNPELTSESEHD